MRKTLPSKSRFYGFSSYCLCATLLMFVPVSSADASIREEALAAVNNLHQYQLAAPLSQELKSIENSFAYAEDFLKKSQPEIAERYYLLTVQKIRIFLTSMPRSNSASEQPSGKHPDSTPDPVAPEPPGSATLSSEPDSAHLPVPNAGTKEELQKAPLSAPSEQTVPPSDKLIGKLDTYTVVRNDTLRLVAAKLGVSRQHLLEMNDLKPNAHLKPGQRLKYNNRKIIPQHMREGIVINIPDRTLYFFKNGKLSRSLPVALGKPLKNRKYDWTTPTGKFQIVAKQKDPTWRIPASIRSEMEEAGKDVLETVPPGPTNPLGKYAIRTSLPNILIHSTSQPASIYSFASHGCIRVYPEHMEDFFHQIRVKTAGEIIYRPVKLAVTENDRIYLEVHHDTYGKSANPSSEARAQIMKLRLKDRVDWEKVETVIREKRGIAEDVTLDVLGSPTNRAETERGHSGA